MQGQVSNQVCLLRGLCPHPLHSRLPLNRQAHPFPSSAFPDKSLSLPYSAALTYLCAQLWGTKEVWCCPGWCGNCELKCHQFDSQSGHMPGLQARSPLGGVGEASDGCISCTLRCTLLLSPSLLLSLKINKIEK